MTHFRLFLCGAVLFPHAVSCDLGTATAPPETADESTPAKTPLVEPMSNTGDVFTSEDGVLSGRIEMGEGWPRLVFGRTLGMRLRNERGELDAENLERFWTQLNPSELKEPIERIAVEVEEGVDSTLLEELTRFFERKGVAVETSPMADSG